MRIPHTLLLFALTGCPWMGNDDYEENVQDADGDGVVGERFGGRDCQDDNPAVGNCDEDDDGFLSVAAGGNDCNDNAADVNPDAEERCDLVDNDCDGAIDAEDADVVATVALWRDRDGDGEGDLAAPVVCQEYADPDNPQSGIHAQNSDDCDDGDGAVNTEADEACDTIDNDCDGVIDDVGLWPRDDDGDGFGQTGVLLAGSCDLTNATGIAAIGGDCDDGDPAVNPDADEIPYDGVDQDCVPDRDEWDVDFDDHIPAEFFAAAQAANTAAGGIWPFVDGDCDDTDPRRNNDATEVCDGVDNDCDGATDSADLNQAAPGDEPLLRSQVTQVFLDVDGDAHGGTAILVCPIAIDPTIHFTTSTDCFDDGDAPAGLEGVDPAEVNDGAAESCDGFDNNCDARVDWDTEVFPGSATFYADQDGDGYGTTERQACSSNLAQGLASEPDDCDDGDPGRFPGAPEICGNAVREDCVQEICDDEGCQPASVFDCDLDGYEGSYLGGGNGDDCNDVAAAAFPGNPEVCDGLDNDCNGAADLDDGNVDQSVLPDWLPDLDGDGFGDSSVPPLNQCNAPVGPYTVVGGDCDDSDPNDRPDGSWYLDRDLDGYGTVGTLTVTGTCEPPAPSPLGDWVRVAGDCNDSSPVYTPDTLWYRDFDGDLVGDPSTADTFCAPPEGETWALASAGEDCNDTNSAVQGTATFYFDNDGDGFGHPDDATDACSPPSNDWVPAGTDCDDFDSAVNPSKVELCNTVDDDCDGLTDDDDNNLVALAGGPVGYADTDGDGFGDALSPKTFCVVVPDVGWSTVSGDCDDLRDDVSPAAVEVCGNAIDDDCDGEEQIPTWYVDADQDGFGAYDPAVDPAPLQQCDAPVGATFASKLGDCDDFEAETFPGAPERAACDGIDDDCDSTPEPSLSWTFDQDLDGYGEDTTALRVCSPPVTRPNGATQGDWVLQAGDCDDSDDNITFGQLYYRDVDADGLGNASSPQFACPPDDGGLVLLLDVDNNGVFDVGDVIGSAFNGDCDDLNELVQGPRTFYVDADNDGWGSTRTSPALICPDASNNPPAGFASQVGDCVDLPEHLEPGDPAPLPEEIFPGAVEITDDGQDNDCDGFIDDENASIQWYLDLDLDGYGSTPLGGYSPGAVTTSGDCDDTSASRHPAHPEVCDSIGDNDCSSATADPELDADLDGYSTCQGDPDDTDPSIGPDQLAWFLDEDTDGYGTGVPVLSPSKPGPAYVLLPGDCDDSAPNRNPGVLDDTCDGVDDNCNGATDEDTSATAWFVDADGDGEGAGAPFYTCAPPAGFVPGNEDCDDTDPAVNPLSVETCDGLDTDCDGFIGVDEADLDGDGWLACEECDDTNVFRNPGQPEACDGVADNDCSGLTLDPELDVDGDGASTCQGDPDDSDPNAQVNQLQWYEDTDGDGYGGTNVVSAAQSPGPTWRTTFGDCDDSDNTRFPGAADITCDGIDQDCDGNTDDDAPVDAKTAFYPDLDGDLEGRMNANAFLACAAPAGFVAGSTDCDDANAAINTAASETCDGVDTDCDGFLDPTELTDVDGDGAPVCSDCDDTEANRYPGATEACDGIVDNDCGLETADIDLDGDGDGYSTCDGDPNDLDPASVPALFLWYTDADGDGYGTGVATQAAAPPTPMSVVLSGDCNDADPTVNPEALDTTCDSIDQDCDGVQGNDNLSLPIWFLDADLDGFGRDSATTQACVPPAAFAPTGGDCNDLDPSTFPGATELCDGRDNACAGSVPADELTDSDGDGYAECADCDDQLAARNAGQAEICDGILDNDCGGELTDIELDGDADGASECEGDPNDTNPGVTAPLFTWYLDSDLDGYGTGTGTASAGPPSANHVLLNGDCDDGAASINPGALDNTCDDVDQDCSGTDANDSASLPIWFVDNDGDGRGREGSVALLACDAPQGYVSGPDDDCDDADASVRPGVAEVCDGKDTDCSGSALLAELTDLDGDGSAECFDCDDNNPARTPGRAEICDGVVDNDCGQEPDDIELDGDADGASECEGDPNDANAGVTAPVLTWYVDSDGDGYGAGTGTDGTSAPSVDHVLLAGDCDDAVDTVFPGADDATCDGIDQDCTGSDANNHPNLPSWFLDADGDSEGRLGSVALRACDAPSGYVAGPADDCDDLNPTVNTGATELCDGLDTDCVGGVPANELIDDDADGALFCADCDDDEPARFPGNPEVCDGIVDNDCGGEPQDLDTDNDGDGANACQGDPNDDDADVSAPDITWFQDLDGDGYGSDIFLVASIDPGANWVSLTGDCDDANDLILPGIADDDCDGVDSDCDGAIDDDSASLIAHWPDTDVDSFGDLNHPPTYFCAGFASAGFVANDQDCNDQDFDTKPGAAEICNGLDDNCDTLIPANEEDGDFDGFAECEDCDDDDSNTYPGAPIEYCDGKDNNCDGGMADFGNGPTPDVPNPFQGTRNDEPFGESQIMLGDSDGDGTPTILALEPICDDSNTSNPTVTITYTNGDPDYVLHFANSIQDIIDADDCDTGMTNTSATGQVRLADRDGDGYGAIEQVEDVAMEGCGDTAPTDFVVYDSNNGEDCEPFDSSRWYEAQPGDYFDADGDGFIAAISSGNTYQCVGAVAQSTPGIDCDDFYFDMADSQVGFSGQNTISTSDDLDAALTFCRSANLRIDTDQVMFRGFVQPMSLANLNFEPLYYGASCNEANTFSCMQFTAPMIIGADTSISFYEMPISGDIQVAHSSASLNVTNSQFYDTTIESLGTMSIYNSTFYVEDGESAFELTDTYNTFINDTVVRGSSSFGGATAVDASSSGVYLTNTEFKGLDWGVDGIGGTNAICTDCTFTDVNHPMQTIDDTSFSFSECTNCSFSNVSGPAMVAYGAGGAEAQCDGCEQLNTAGILIDTVDPSMSGQDGNVALRNTVITVGTGPIVQAGTASVILEEVELSGVDRPLLTARGDVNASEVIVRNVFNSSAVFTLDPVGGATMNLTNFEGDGIFNGYIVEASGGHINFDGELQNVRGIIRDTSGSITIDAAGLVIDGAYVEPAFNLSNSLSTVSLLDLDASFVQRLLKIDGGQAYVDNLIGTSIDQLVEADNGASVVVVDTTITDSQAYVSLVDVDSSTVLLTGARLLDISINGSNPAVRTSGGQSTTAFYMDQSLLWTFGAGNALVMDGATVDLSKVTFYTPDASLPRIIGPGLFTNDLALSRVLFHDEGAFSQSECAVVAPLATLSANDLWLRTSNESAALGCRSLGTLNYTTEDTTGPANFNAFSRVPLNSTVRNGWGELAD